MSRASLTLLRSQRDVIMDDLLAAMRKLIDMLNATTASGLITHEIELQTLRVDRLLRKVETCGAPSA